MSKRPLSAKTKLALDELLPKVGESELVFVSGTFNIVHPGHLRLLRFAAECGKFLAVGILSDDLARSAQLNCSMRIDGVDAISWVDYTFELDEPPEVFIERLKPSVVVKGKEHEETNNPEQPILEAYGGKLLFGSGGTTFSSLELLKAETETVNHSSIVDSMDYISRHKIDVVDFEDILVRMRELRVCVVGDTIVDEYIQCDPLGMSQEDPTIVVTPIMVNRFLGGAGIVAAHARGLGAAKVRFVTVSGSDDAREYIADKLVNYGVDASIVVDDSRPTTLKKRYRVGNKTLLRVSQLRQHKIDKNLQDKVLESVLCALDETDLLIFSDFNYGALPQELVDAITRECEKRGVMVVADSQSSSQIGDVSRFKNVALFTPTEREARLAMSNHEDGLVVLAEALRLKANAQNVAITLGAEGVLIHAVQEGTETRATDRLPTLNTAPKDTAGAGDCLLVCTAMALALGSSIWASLYLGSIAAACQVGRIGNVPLTAADLKIETRKLKKLI